MKRTKSILTILVIAIVIFCQSTMPTSAATITPTYDISGVWNAPSPIQIFQEGTEIQMIYINQLFAHHSIGRYISPTKIKYTVTRRNRSNGCQTTMEGIMTVNSVNSLSTTDKGMDSACDLTPSYTGAGNITRVL